MVHVVREADAAPGDDEEHPHDYGDYSDVQ